jgi:CopG family nickel-responsive transcriptional regulator
MDSRLCFQPAPAPAASSRPIRRERLGVLVQDPEDTLARISVSLPSDLLRSLDRLVGRNGFPSRSHAIAVMVKKSIAEESSASGAEHAVGTLTVMYDNAYDVLKHLDEVRKLFREHIVSGLHSLLLSERTLEVLLLQGPAQRLSLLRREMLALRGVCYANLQLVFTEMQ